MNGSATTTNSTDSKPTADLLSPEKSPAMSGGLPSMGGGAGLGDQSLGMSDASTGGAEFPYRALSRGSVVSMILAIIALPGLMESFAPLLVLTIIGLIAGVLAIRTTRRYPEEYSGGGLAKAALTLNLLLLVGGCSLHAYTYATEVPEGYTRVHFYDLQVPDGSPQEPTDIAINSDGDDIFLKGYIHPSSGGGMLKQFILVPDLGTCCFGGQPKSSDMVEVTLMGNQRTIANLRKKKLAGTFKVAPVGSKLNEFDNAIFYRMKVDQLK
ncbi:MAG: hypothetical protein AAF664_00205 [Planctomycetota bacterium]